MTYRVLMRQVEKGQLNMDYVTLLIAKIRKARDWHDHTAEMIEVSRLAKYLGLPPWTIYRIAKIDPIRY